MSKIAVHIVYDSVDDIFSVHAADKCPRSRLRCTIWKVDRSDCDNMLRVQYEYYEFQEACRGVYLPRWRR